MEAVDKDTFQTEVIGSDMPVVVDLWGPQCGPCLALMPSVDELAGEFGGKVKFRKLNVAENRRLVISLKIMSVPAFLFYKGGERVKTLVGDEVSLDAIRKQAADLA